MLEKEQVEVFTTEFKSSDPSSAEVVANPIYANSILSFKQGLKLLWSSGLVLVLLLFNESHSNCGGAVRDRRVLFKICWWSIVGWLGGIFHCFHRSTSVHSFAQGKSCCLLDFKQTRV